MSAAKEYLVKQLMFHEEEIQIKTIKMSPNLESKIMWIEIGELNVRRLFHRMKTLRNPVVQLINYIPPELWVKKKKLEVQLKAAKNVNKDLCYIIKLGKTDLILLTKIVNVSYWEEDDMTKYLEPNDDIDDPARKRKQSPQHRPSPKRFLSTK